MEVVTLDKIIKYRAPVALAIKPMSGGFLCLRGRGPPAFHNARLDGFDFFGEEGEGEEKWIFNHNS
jgi:hypothetical protein